MAKGSKKTKGPALPQLPNHWVKATSITGSSSCTECGVRLGKGMRWVVGDIKACQRCGQRLARTGLAA